MKLPIFRASMLVPRRSWLPPESTHDQVTPEERNQLLPGHTETTRRRRKRCSSADSRANGMQRRCRRNPDGTWSDEKTHALWRWYFILDGHAIQDDWIKLEEGNRAVVGTNIRIFNPEEEQWQMAWIDTTNRRLATFTAVSEGDTIVMTGHNAQGRMVRNTFSNITGEQLRLDPRMDGRLRRHLVCGLEDPL